MTRADNREELIAGLKEAAANDRRMLVEEMIVGREIECGVFGDGASTKASGVGEILAAAEFYDFDAKYYNAESNTVVDPDTESLSRSLRQQHLYPLTLPSIPEHMPPGRFRVRLPCALWKAYPWRLRKRERRSRHTGSSQVPGFPEPFRLPRKVREGPGIQHQPELSRIFRFL